MAQCLINQWNNFTLTFQWRGNLSASYLTKKTAVHVPSWSYSSFSLWACLWPMVASGVISSSNRVCTRVIWDQGLCLSLLYRYMQFSCVFEIRGRVYRCRLYPSFSQKHCHSNLLPLQLCSNLKNVAVIILRGISSRMCVSLVTICFCHLELRVLYILRKTLKDSSLDRYWCSTDFTVL